MGLSGPSVFAVEQGHAGKAHFLAENLVRRERRQYVLNGPAGADVVIGFGRLEKSIVQQNIRRGNGADDPFEIAPNGIVGVVAVDKEQGRLGPAPLGWRKTVDSFAVYAERRLQTVPLKEVDPFQLFDIHPPSLSGMFDVVHIIRQIN